MWPLLTTTLCVWEIWSGSNNQSDWRKLFCITLAHVLWKCFVRVLRVPKTWIRTFARCLSLVTTPKPCGEDRWILDQRALCKSAYPRSLVVFLRMVTINSFTVKMLIRLYLNRSCISEPDITQVRLFSLYVLTTNLSYTFILTYLIRRLLYKERSLTHKRNHYDEYEMSIKWIN